MAILIKETTAAVTSEMFTANANNAGLICNGLGVGETVKLQVQYGDNEFVDVLIGGKTPCMDSNNNMLTIFQDAMLYRVVKSATVKPVKVMIYQNSGKLNGYTGI